jgi:hypothetical protein
MMRAAVILTFALTACQFTKPQLVSPPPSPPPVAATAPAAITATRALQLFEATCDAALRAGGITGPNQTSLTEDVSVRIQDGPADGKTCAMTFGTTDAAATVQATFSALGTFKPTPLGTAAKYRGRNAIVIISGESRRIGAVGYHTIRLLSER